MRNPKATLASLLVMLGLLSAGAPNMGCASMTPSQQYAIAVDLKTAAQTTLTAAVFAGVPFTDAQLDAIDHASAALDEAQVKARAALDAGDQLGLDYWIKQILTNQAVLAQVYEAATGKKLPATRPAK